jgi:uncharacterized protein YecE (DUF72 family)
MACLRLSGGVLIERESLAARLRQLAAQGVFLGTSSWKYPGWFGTIYERDRYVWRGRFSNARFERDCLAEYAQVFPTVSVDATYYKFPDHTFLDGLAEQVPPTFQFAFKVSDDITLKHFPQLPRFGRRAGQENPHFLDAARFADAFLAPCEAIRDKVGLLMFEFSRFHADQFSRGAEFVEVLETFLGELPRGWPYAVELRNRQWLRPEYFAALARQGVTHVFNAWADMPPVEEQIQMPGSETNPGLCAARFLLREGRKYEEAVKQFSPYGEIKDPNPSGRAAAAALVRRGKQSNGKTKVLIYVNNRFEGHSPGTIRAVLDQVEGDGCV